MREHLSDYNETVQNYWDLTRGLEKTIKIQYNNMNIYI